MNKYQLANILIVKAKESENSLDKFLLKLNTYLKEVHGKKLFKDTVLFLKSKKRQKYSQVTLTSAEALSENRISEIRKQYEALFYENEIRYENDENLIGGFRIDTNDKRIDGSFKKQLTDLYQTMRIVN